MATLALTKRSLAYVYLEAERFPDALRELAEFLETHNPFPHSVMILAVDGRNGPQSSVRSYTATIEETPEA